MPWPAAQLTPILTEVVAAFRAQTGLVDPVGAAAERLGIARSTAYDWLANPDRPRQLSTLLNVQTNYDALAPEETPRGKNSTKLDTPFWLLSHLADVHGRPGDTGWQMRHKVEESPDYPKGWMSTGWIGFDMATPADYAREFGLQGEDIGWIYTARRTD